MKPVGLTEDVGWEIGVSRTLDAPLEAVWDLLVSPAGADLWIGAGASIPLTKGERYATAAGDHGELRGRIDRERIRVTQQRPDREGPTTMQFALRANGGRTRVTFHEEHLADADEREARRAHWKAVMDDVEAALAG